MIEHPVYIPFRGDHLAAVLTVPDGEPRGLVVLAPGLGATRSHRFRMWTTAARRLAHAKGVAALRLDFRSFGDSTGEERSWTMGEPWVEQLACAATFGLAASGTERVVAVGNCVGARASLGVAAEMPGCVGAFLIRMPIFEHGAQANVAQRVRQSRRLATMIRSTPVVRELARGRRHGLVSRPSTFLRDAFPRAVRRGAHLLFLYGEHDFTFGRAADAALRRLGSTVEDDVGANWELRVIPGRSLLGFQSVDTQAAVVNAVVEWSAARLDSRLAPSPRGAAPLAGVDPR